MAVRSPDDPRDSESDDDAGGPYRGGGRDAADPRAGRDGTAPRDAWPWPRAGRLEAADPATAAQAKAAAACGYPVCADCRWFAVTAVYVEYDGGRSFAPYCDECAYDHVAEGGREWGLEALAAANSDDDAGPAFRETPRAARTDWLLAEQTSGPDIDRWIKAENGPDTTSVVNVRDET